jgi:hypothetical protein
MRFRVPTHLSLALILTLALAPAAMAGEEVFVSLEANGLEPLPAGFAYEGWLIVNGSPVSTGLFGIDASGQAHPGHVRVSVDSADAVEAFVLSIEPVPDADPAPSAVKLLGGAFSGGTAVATIDHAAALGTDLSTASGSYILAAPSGGEGADYRNGIWFLDPSGPSATLELPALPESWVYEGWVVGPDGPISTGRFGMPDGPDSDLGGLGSGPHGTPPFPGQDLIHPPMDLTGGYAAVISVEPVPDTSTAPFTLKPLVDGTIDDVGMGTLQGLTNMAENSPTLTARLMSSSQAMTTVQLHLAFDGLEDLGSEAAYEGWIVVDGTPYSTGVFTVDGAGVASAEWFPTEIPADGMMEAFVLTIEPVPDSDPGPSSVHILGGDIVHGRSTLTIDHGAALGTDFSTLAGSYMLAAPSAGAAGDYRNGIWWLDPNAGPGATLELPTLPAGWVYEGWVVGPDGPMTTGRFTSASGADSDGGGATAGPESTPPFPGQDFVNPPVVLTDGYAAVISVEPEPDNSPAPFTLKPLMDPFIDDLGEGVLQPMHHNTAAFPTGRMTVVSPEIIPAAANALGVNDTIWLTSLEAANHGLGMAAFTMIYHPEDGASQPDPVRVTLAPGASVRYDDVVGGAFGISGSGTIALFSADEGLIFTSRTYSIEDGATYGQGLPAHSPYDAFGFGETARFAGLSQSSSDSEGFRSNLGMVNTSEQTISVHIAFFDASGVQVATRMMDLSAGERRQLNGPLPAGTNVASAAVWTTTPGGHFLAYASVVDNQTGDATTLLPIR